MYIVFMTYQDDTTLPGETRDYYHIVDTVSEAQALYTSWLTRDIAIAIIAAGWTEITGETSWAATRPGQTPDH